MTDKNTVEAIVAEAEASRLQLTSLHDALQSEIDEIASNAAKQGREPTDAEKEQRKLLRAEQAKVLEAFKELAFVTLVRLDNSDDVKQLQTSLKSINANLNDDLERLKKIATYAKIAAQVADGLAKLAAQAAAIAAKA
jgi:hypothetical protein